MSCKVDDFRYTHQHWKKLIPKYCLQKSWDQREYLPPFHHLLQSLLILPSILLKFLCGFSLPRLPTIFSFKAKKNLSQMNEALPIGLKFKRYAGFNEWGIRMMTFCGRQNIINIWHFPYKISRCGHKSLVQKAVWRDNREMTVKCLNATNPFN